MKPNTLAAIVLAALGCACADAVFAGLAASPALPAYGQAVFVELRDTSWPMYLPATRYVRSGNAIDIDYEYLTDGFGPSRPDFGEQPLALGELAPGNYQVRARLHDIAKPSAAPIEYSMQIAVMPPSAWGIYLLPLAPRAYAATEVIIRSAAFLDPASMRSSVSGSVVRIQFDYRDDAPATGATPPNMSTFGSVAIPGLAPGTYQVEGWGRTGPDAPYELFFRRAFSVGLTVPVIEFYSAILDHYFIAAGADEIALLERGGQGDWKRSGQQFSAWIRAADAPASASSVCRFYARGPNSHFYTGSRQECDYLKGLELQQRAEASARGAAFLGWGYEGIAFWAVVPQGGACPAGMSPIYRAYNDRAAQIDSNHRFMVDARQRDAMSVGWLDEGVHLCSAT